MTEALALLVKRNLIRGEKRETRGRPATIWHATTPYQPCKPPSNNRGY
jgi:hypothetical protein